MEAITVAQIEEKRDHIAKQLDYIENKLDPAIDKYYDSKISEILGDYNYINSRNFPQFEESIKKWDRKRKHQRLERNNIFEQYDNLEVALKSMLDRLNNNSKKNKNKEEFEKMMKELDECDEILTYWKDMYIQDRVINRLELQFNSNNVRTGNDCTRNLRTGNDCTRKGRTHNRRTGNGCTRNNRSRSPTRNTSNRNTRNRNRTTRNCNKVQRQSRGRIRIHPVAKVRMTDPIGSRGNTTHTSSEINQMRRQALRNIIAKYGSMSAYLEALRQNIAQQRESP